MDHSLEGVRSYTDYTIRVQHDWHLCLREPVSQFYISMKPNPTSSRLEFHVQVTKMIDVYACTVLPPQHDFGSIDKFQVSIDDFRNLHVSYHNQRTIFVPPCAQITTHGLASSILSLDFSKSGQSYVAADNNGNMVVANATNGQPMRFLRGHTLDVNRCRYLPSDLVIISGGLDMSVRIWGIDDGTCARVLMGHTREVTGIGVLGIGKEVLSCSKDGSAIKWHVGEGKILEQWKFDSGDCVDLAVSLDNSMFAVICELGILSIIRLNGAPRIDIYIPQNATCLCFAENVVPRHQNSVASQIFVGFDDGHIALYGISEKVFSTFVAEVNTFAGKVTRLIQAYERLIVGFSDGRIAVYPVSIFTPGSPGIGGKNDIIAEFELTGTDLNPINDIVVVERYVYICSRDMLIKRYAIPWN
ncbi:unnamed protein product [Caenorhabditis bovis]|uniref:Uncharacterized protein n=1 Tax=Caenorhabditis bovis TaxID=2654633 RepID=A0A8S1FAN2_9PELO|nr:unnamed protein product [Caenorhabditis bovis]